MGLGGIEQLEDAPEYSDTQRRARLAQKWRRKIENCTTADQPEIAAEHYYDYEARFVKQKREQERINILPRVIKPAMFAKGEFALGDMRVFQPLHGCAAEHADLRLSRAAFRRADRSRGA